MALFSRGCERAHPPPLKVDTHASVLEFKQMGEKVWVYIIIYMWTIIFIYEQTCAHKYAFVSVRTCLYTCISTYLYV